MAVLDLLYNPVITYRHQLLMVANFIFRYNKMERESRDVLVMTRLDRFLGRPLHKYIG